MPVQKLIPWINTINQCDHFGMTQIPKDKKKDASKFILTNFTISCWLSLASVADQVFSEFCDIFQKNVILSKNSKLNFAKCVFLKSANEKCCNVSRTLALQKPIWHFKQVVVYGKWHCFERPSWLCTALTKVTDDRTRIVGLWIFKWLNTILDIR